MMPIGALGAGFSLEPRRFGGTVIHLLDRLSGLGPVPQPSRGRRWRAYLDLGLRLMIAGVLLLAVLLAR